MAFGASPFWQGLTLNLLRIIAGFLYLQHGAQKLFGVLGGTPVDWLSFLGFAGMLEFFGGLLILLGAFTRPVAFVLAGQMAVAYWMVHGLQGFWPIVNKGELAALYCFVFLLLWTHGGGGFSLDALLGKKKAG
jgi:putative oxidoreductase